jgi:hypothetical protein
MLERNAREDLQISICTVITESLLQYIVSSHICRSSEKSQCHLMSKIKFWWKVRALRKINSLCSCLHRIPYIYRTQALRNWSRNIALHCSSVISAQCFSCYHEVKFKTKRRGLSLAVAFCLILERYPVRISVRISIIVAVNVVPFFSQSRQIPRQCLGLGSSRFLSHPSQFIIRYSTHFDVESQVVGTSLSTLPDPPSPPPSLYVYVCMYIYILSNITQFQDKITMTCSALAL